MTQEETLRLWSKCEAARSDALANGEPSTVAHARATAVWAAWAGPLLVKRKELQARGEWSAWPDLSGRLVGLNQPTADYLSSADAVFSSSEQSYSFKGDVSFTGFSFPGRAEFNGAAFPATASFNAVMFTDAAEFREANFSGSAEFQGATFADETSFQAATFERASFSNARFEKRVEFSASFGNDATFWQARFEAPVDFEQSRFRRTADFTSADFIGDANFQDARFDAAAVFTHVTFGGYVSFAGATFVGPANFQAMKAERFFTLEHTRFQHVPDFVQAHFSEAPRLDNSDFQNVFTRGEVRSDAAPGDRSADDIGDDDARGRQTSLAARFRALKRLAIAGHDSERELAFNAGEILSRRGVEDFRLGPNATRYWLGWLYEMASDFGRSIGRPIRLWILLTLVFAAFYVGPWSGRPISFQSVTDCVAVPNRHLSKVVPMRLSSNAIVEALQLSVRNATFVFGSADANAEWRTLGCLYGSSEDSPTVRSMPRAAATAAAVQRVLSATLVVLFGMAIRNMLKMK